MDPVSRRDVLRASMVTTAVVGGMAAAGAAGAAVNTSERASSATGGRNGVALVPAAELGSGWISVVDYGAVGDGKTNDTTAIQAAFNAARGRTPSPGVYFPPGHTYRVNDQLLAAGMSDFVISGYGATLALAGAATSVKGAKAVLQLRDCHRFKVLGLAVRDTDRVQQYNGISIVSSSAGVIEGVVVRDVRFNGIVIFDAVPGSSDDIVITNCTTEGTYFGISSNGRDVRITNNHVAMDWPATDEARQKGGVWSLPSNYFDGINVWAGGDRTVISGNTITECGQAGVSTESCTNLVVSDNTITGCQGRGLQVSNAVGVSITGNVLINCHAHINVLGTRDVTVVGNRVENPRATRNVSCIAINQGSSKAVVVGNHARQAHPTMPAIYVHGACTDVTLAWNSVTAAVAYQAPPDTVLIRRMGPGQIRTDGKIIAARGIGVGNSVAASTPGSVVRKIEVFSSTGASLGWLPVYNSIT